MNLKIRSACVWMYECIYTHVCMYVCAHTLTFSLSPSVAREKYKTLT